MIRHIVLLKFKPESTAAQRAELIQLIEGLKNIDVVRRLDYGDNLSPAPGAFDSALVVDFDDEAALRAYNVHPIHRPVGKLAVELCELTVLDFAREEV